MLLQRAEREEGTITDELLAAAVGDGFAEWGRTVSSLDAGFKLRSGGIPFKLSFGRSWDNIPTERHGYRQQRS